MSLADFGLFSRAAPCYPLIGICFLSSPGVQMRDGGESLAREQPMAALLDSIAREAVRRLARSRVAGEVKLDDCMLTELIAASRVPGPQAAADLTQKLVQSGIRAEDIVDFYIPAAARHLGDLWLQDRLTFAEVTLGTSSLQSALRGLSAAWTADGAHAGQMSFVLLIVPAGEQHSLGAMVMASWLRRRGLSVSLKIAPTAAEISSLLSQKHFDAVFMSVGCRERILPCLGLANSIQSLTRRKIPIAVGGAAIKEEDAATFAGAADVVTNDPEHALRVLGLNLAGLNRGLITKGDGCDI